MLEHWFHMIYIYQQEKMSTKKPTQSYITRFSMIRFPIEIPFRKNVPIATGRSHQKRASSSGATRREAKDEKSGIAFGRHASPAVKICIRKREMLKQIPSGILDQILSYIPHMKPL